MNRSVCEVCQQKKTEKRVEAKALQDNLNDELALSNTFNYITQDFKGLGMIASVTALGCISARFVVERRQETGVLRAIGF